MKIPTPGYQFLWMTKKNHSFLSLFSVNFWRRYLGKGLSDLLYRFGPCKVQMYVNVSSFQARLKRAQLWSTIEINPIYQVLWFCCRGANIVVSHDIAITGIIIKINYRTDGSLPDFAWALSIRRTWLMSGHFVTIGTFKYVDVDIDLAIEIDIHCLIVFCDNGWIW